MLITSVSHGFRVDDISVADVKSDDDSMYGLRVDDVLHIDGVSIYGFRINDVSLDDVKIDDVSIDGFIVLMASLLMA
jgi:hypothetical protein